jgi:prepilin-type N-terminal cleavage/methylation domain-containing protein
VLALTRTWRARRLSGDSGLSLVEMMVSMVVFAIVSSAVVATLVNGLNLTRNNRSRDVAANLASREIDSARNTDLSKLQLGLVMRPAVGEEPLYTVDGTSYTVKRTAEWVSKDAKVGACDGGAGTRQAYLRVSVSVSWPRMGSKTVKADTLITPKIGSYNSASGSLSIKVRDRDARPVGNVPVTISGPSGVLSESTSDDGCAFFAFLKEGDYTVTANKPTYVDLTGVAAPSTTLAAKVGQVTAYAYDYDVGTIIKTRLEGPDATFLVPNGVPVRLGNTNGAFPYGVTVPFPSSAGTALAGPVFPFAQGYTLWAGDCADAKPPSPPLVTTDPGATPTAAAAMPGVIVNTSADAVVYAFHAADTNPAGCPAGASYNLGTTTGLTMNVALPYGTWRLSTDPSPTGTTGTTVTLVPGAAQTVLVTS